MIRGWLTGVRPNTSKARSRLIERRAICQHSTIRFYCNSIRICISNLIDFRNIEYMFLLMRYFLFLIDFYHSKYD